MTLSFSRFAFLFFLIGPMIDMQDVFAFRFFYFFVCFFYFFIFQFFLKKRRKEIGKGYNAGPHCLLLSAVHCSDNTAVVVETASVCDATKLYLLLGSKVFVLANSG